MMMMMMMMMRRRRRRRRRRRITTMTRKITMIFLMIMGSDLVKLQALKTSLKNLVG